MGAADLVTAVILFVFAACMLFLGIRSLFEKGILLNNAYFYASGKERTVMDKKPYYRQSGVVFCLISLIVTVIGLAVILGEKMLLWLELPLFAAMIAYAVVSTVRIGKRTKP